MNSKIGITITIIVVVLLGWLILKGNTADYAVAIENEVDSLEAELILIEEQTASGELTPEQAVEAHVKITKRLDTIQKAVQSSEKSTLTDEARISLSLSLERFAELLKTYQSTLVAIDEVVSDLPAEDQPRWRNGGGANNTDTSSIVEIVTEVVENIEEYVEEINENVEDEQIEEDDTEVDTEDDTEVTDEDVAEAEVSSDEEVSTEETL